MADTNALDSFLKWAKEYGTDSYWDKKAYGKKNPSTEEILAVAEEQSVVKAQPSFEEEGALIAKEYLKNPRMADAAPKNMELRASEVAGDKVAQGLGKLMSPEVIKELEAKRDALVQKRRDLEDRRRFDEYDAMVRARQVRARDSALKATGQ